MSVAGDAASPDGRWAAEAKTDRDSAAPLISIVVPTRDRIGLLTRALDSIARQRARGFEVIVVDDGSTPDNIAALAELENRYDSRFVFLQRGSIGIKQGPDFARNSGVAHASGRYVTFLDDDDYWCDDGHIEEVVRCLEAHPEVDLFVANQKAVLGDATIVPVWLPDLEKRLSPERCVLPPDTYLIERSDLLFAGGIGFAHVNISTVRRDLFLEIGGFWGDAPYEGDLNFFLRLVDRADAFAYRSVTVSVNTVRPPEDSSGVSSISAHSKILLRIAHCQHALLHCTSPDVRRYARGLLSGCFKDLAKQFWERGEWRHAALFATNAVAAAPSLRWIAIAAYLWFGALSSRLRRSERKQG